MPHRHKDSRLKWTTSDDAESHPADVLTVSDVAKLKLLIAAGGGGGTTPTPNPPDPPAPDIAPQNIAISGVTTTGAVISWTTTDASTGLVQYGPTIAYGSSTSSTSSGTTGSRTLPSLTPNTTYHFRVVTNSGSTTLYSSDRSFTTAQTTPPTPPPTSLVFGPAVAYETKANERLDGAKQSFRFRAGQTSNAVSVAVNVRTGTGYSAGTGGTIKASLQTDSGGNPSGTILGSVTWSPGNPGTAEDKAHHTLSSAVPLTTGTIYHLVCENTDASPTVNYVSVNMVLHWNPASTPRQPAFSDDFAVLRKTAAWGLQNGYIPVFDITYSNGQHDGNMYFAVIIGNYALIGGTSNMARSRWTAPSTETYQAANVQVRRNSGSADLVVRLEQGDGTLIESVSIPASSIPIVAPGAESPRVPFTRVPFVSNRTLTSGQTYNLRLSCAAGTQYSVMPLRWADDDMTAWGGYHFEDGAGLANGSSGQKTTDGTNWVDLYAFSPVDIGFYLEVAP
jgi:hypothetical protein